MGNYILSKQAETDIDLIVDFIAQDNLQSGLEFYDEVDRICTLIGTMPDMGSIVDFIEVPEYRMFPIGRFRSYWVFYAMHDETPMVARVFHVRQDIAGHLFGED